MSIDPNSVVFGNDRWLDFAAQDLFPNEKIAFEKMGLFRDRGLRIADLGCGSGRVAEKLAALGHTVKALDVSEEIIRRVNGSGQKMGAEYVCGNAAALPYADQEFDHVIFAYNGLTLMENDPDRVRAVREMARVLKRDGQIYIGNHNLLGHLYKRLRRPSWTSLREVAQLLTTHELQGELRSRPASEGLIRKWLEGAGFTEIEPIYSSKKNSRWLASCLTKDIGWVARRAR